MSREIDHSGLGSSYLRTYPGVPITHEEGAACDYCAALAAPSTPEPSGDGGCPECGLHLRYDAGLARCGHPYHQTLRAAPSTPEPSGRCAYQCSFTRDEHEDGDMGHRFRAAPSTPEPSGLRAKIEVLPTQLGWDDGTGEASHWVDRAAVLALLDGAAPSTEPALDVERLDRLEKFAVWVGLYTDDEHIRNVAAQALGLAESQP